MKKIISLLFATGFFLVVAPAFAQGSMMMGNTATTTQQTTSPAIDAALQDIYKTQSISSQSQIICSKVTDNQYEKLGDASMGAGITEQQHTVMENMMGGEGSATVKQAHINMGRSYLGCWANYNSAPSMGMMGNIGAQSGFMNDGHPRSGMMGGFGGIGGMYRGFAWFGGITTILVWSVLILSIISLLKWLKKNKNV
jgi:hypothetical protein